MVAGGKTPRHGDRLVPVSRETVEELGVSRKGGESPSGHSQVSCSVAQLDLGGLDVFSGESQGQ